jgi:hypothetical protein
MQKAMIMPVGLCQMCASRGGNQNIEVYPHDDQMKIGEVSDEDTAINRRNKIGNAFPHITPALLCLTQPRPLLLASDFGVSKSLIPR